jgi:hypothetical protein
VVKKDGRPFEAWLYGRMDLRVKAQCVAAILLLAALAITSAFEFRNRSFRAEAYIQAGRAMQSQDFAAAMDETARFFRRSVLTEDAREPEMANLYDEALLMWLMWQNPPAEEFQRRVEARPANRIKQ